MTACMTEGDLRAFLDGELRPPEALSTSRHLLSCPRCRDHIERLRTRATNVSLLMDSLETGAVEFRPDCADVFARIQYQAPDRLTQWAIPWAAVGAAGMLTLFLAARALTPTRNVAPEPAVVRRAAPASEQIPEAPVSLSLSLPVTKTPDPKHPAGFQEARTDYFLELDDGEPIQMGFVVRMSLPALVLSPWEPMENAEEMQADVIVDEGGRARAIRFLK